MNVIGSSFLKKTNQGAKLIHKFEEEKKMNLKLLPLKLYHINHIKTEVMDTIEPRKLSKLTKTITFPQNK